jgi:hypothetical protein
MCVCMYILCVLSLVLQITLYGERAGVGGRGAYLHSVRNECISGVSLCDVHKNLVVTSPSQGFEDENCGHKVLLLAYLDAECAVAGVEIV